MKTLSSPNIENKSLCSRIKTSQRCNRVRSRAEADFECDLGWS